MTPERWRQIKTIYQQAAEVEPEKRRLFVREQTGDDADLQREVESMLKFSADADGFIEAPAFDVAIGLLANENALPSGKKLGNYRIIREIGRGGMGAVYLAERDDELFDKRVAIKVIKRGMDSDAILRRFSVERQILASLDHPNIARLLDGGTTDDGLPYFVLEYVEGLPINEFCQQNELGLRERLQLFRKVCAAVSYAHQNLIVHRDLKPSNILVTEAGEPKLLDFGIAKVLKAQSWDETTKTEITLFTPEYASPEQVRGEKLTTATDVYSLGVILYELLTDSRPYKISTGNIGEVIRSICETMPERPSSAVSRQPSKSNPRRTADSGRLTKQLKGDLDTILLTALRKDVARRYASVEQLSEDLWRYLENLPIKARRDSTVYRAGKFVQRNRVALAATSLAILLLLSSAVFSFWQAARANAERARAEKRFSDVRKLANSLVHEYTAEAEKLAGATALRQKMVRDALFYLDSLAADATNEPTLEKELAAAYLKIGDVQGKPWTANLNDGAGALESYQKARSILEKLRAQHPADREIQIELSRADEAVGEIQMRDLKVDEAIESYEKAFALRENLVRSEPENRVFRKLLADSLFDLGDGWAVKGGEIISQDKKSGKEFSEKSLALFRQAADICEALRAAEPESIEPLYAVAKAHQRIGYRLDWLGSELEKKDELLNQALEHYEKAFAALNEAQRLEPENARIRRFIADVMLFKGELLAKQNRTDEARKVYEKSLAEFERLAAEDAANGEAQRDVVEIRDRLGRLFLQTGDRRRAAEEFQKAISILEKLLEMGQDKSLAGHLVNIRNRLNLALK